MQPFWNSDADNLQFWLFSRLAGLRRYRVFRGGIWNVETMQKGWQENQIAGAVTGMETIYAPVQPSRTFPGPVMASGGA